MFCLLEYSNELQSQCSNLERENEVLRGQRIDASQAALDAERKCAAIQKDRMKDREASRNLEINLRDQHKAERLELQQWVMSLFYVWPSLTGPLMTHCYEIEK